MTKNLKVAKKNLMAIGIACTMVLTSGCAQSGKMKTVPEYSTIYMTEYDTVNHELYWDEKTQGELDSIADDIIATEKIEDGTLYVASYQSLGYEAAMRNDTKIDAINNNPELGSNPSFTAGYDLGKADKYLKKAQEERRTYVSITAATGQYSSTEEANYYPLDELTVISYNGKNAIVSGYNRNDIKDGNYIDLLGQDMTDYIGQEFSATSLRDFATENIDSLPDALYIVSDDYRHIAEITTATMEETVKTHKLK